MLKEYYYWLVRYVPDVVRGERVNVAVIVGSDDGDWAIKSAPNLKRASRLGGDANVLRPWLNRLNKVIKDNQSPPLNMFASHEQPRVSKLWLENLSHRYNNVLQISKTRPVLAVTAEEGCEFLYKSLVKVPEPAKKSHTRLGLVRNLSELYQNTANLVSGESLLRYPRIVTGKQRGKFDFAVKDEKIGQLSQAFAFDVRDPHSLEREIQSWNFIVNRLRQEGATIPDTENAKVSTDVNIAVAYQEHTANDSQTLDIFEAAIEAWNDLNIKTVPAGEITRIALDARNFVLS